MDAALETAACVVETQLEQETAALAAAAAAEAEEEEEAAGIAAAAEAAAFEVFWLLSTLGDWRRRINL